MIVHSIVIRLCCTCVFLLIVVLLTVHKESVDRAFPVTESTVNVHVDVALYVLNILPAYYNTHIYKRIPRRRVKEF